MRTWPGSVHHKWNISMVICDTDMVKGDLTKPIYVKQQQCYDIILSLCNKYESGYHYGNGFLLLLSWTVISRSGLFFTLYNICVATVDKKNRQRIWPYSPCRLSDFSALGESNQSRVDKSEYLPQMRITAV
jgi:hypothetical protein